jgi:hypothetical protein
MHAERIEFGRPVKVMQVFRNVNLYGKSKKSFEARRAEMQWGDIFSKSGHVIDGQLFLPASVSKDPDVRSCDLITLEDDNQEQVFSAAHLQFTKVIRFLPRLPHPPLTNRFMNLTRPNKLDIFELRNEGELELYLEHGYYTIGIPKRSNFKLCEVKLDQPVQIKINGKTDHSLSRGRERIFKEQHYVFHYLGDFSSATLQRDPFKAVHKSVPHIVKEVDLIKQLW